MLAAGFKADSLSIAYVSLLYTVILSSFFPAFLNGVFFLLLFL